MESTKTYQDGHLFVAAVRILEHQKATPPLIEDVCHLLSFSLEHGHFLCKQLEEMGIVELVEGGYGKRVFIKDHLALEKIPREGGESRLDEALKSFQSARKAYEKKVATIKADQEKKKQNLFADLEKKLKQDLKKKK
jgi:exonuclease VII small subunit